MTLTTPCSATQMLIELNGSGKEVRLLEAAQDSIIPAGYARLYSAAFLGWMKAPCGGKDPQPLTANAFAYQNPGQSPRLSLLSAVSGMDDLQVPPGNVITYVHHELGRCASAVMPLGELYERCFTHAQRALDGWFEPVAMDEEHYYSLTSEETINGEPAVCVARVALAARGAVLAPRPREDAATLLYNTTAANDVIELSANKKHLLHRIEALQLSPLDRQIFACFMACAAQWIATNVSFAEGCVTLAQPVSPAPLRDAN